MSKYQYSKLVMEKFLRRSFYDAVLELYETSQGTRIISVSLEGNLNLVVNKDESFLIKLNEVAQRADDREDHQRYKDVTSLKLESFDHYGMKKEEISSEQFPHVPMIPETPHDLISEGINYKLFAKENKDGGESSKAINTHFDSSKCAKSVETVEGKMVENKSETDLYDTKSSDTESESEEEGDADTSPNHHHHHLPLAASGNLTTMDEKTGSACPVGDDISFLPVGQYSEYKRKFDYKDQDLSEHLGKKSPTKKRKAIQDEIEEDVSKLGDREKLNTTATASSTEVEDSSSGLQLLPHTATGPIIVEDEENFNSGISESQMAQLAMMQMREQNINMFRPQELEELARQQQQWQMVAYQRTIMEKSYLQHQMQQYQRETERFRWEYVAQQARDYPQSAEEIEKEYSKQAAQTQNSNSEVAMLTNTTVLLDESKKNIREGNVEIPSTGGMENISSQYMRMFSEEPNTSQVDTDYEEGELRPEIHNCALCGTKFQSMDLLLRHMEKHRVAFERTCSVCQLGTLTGNMLILHMEASHGPDPSFSQPSSTPVTTMTMPLDTTAVISAAADYAQLFSNPSTTAFTTTSDQTAGIKMPQQHQPVKQTSVKESSSKLDTSTENNVKPEMISASFSYASPTVANPSAADSVVASSSSSMTQDNFLGIPSQFYPLIICQLCGEKFALSDALDQHVESCHKDETVTYSCKVCTLTFSKHVELSKHMTKHETSSSNLKCSHCLKSFKSVKQLRLHYVAAHSCCHFCEYCRAGFPDAMALQLHEQLHTLDPEKLTFRCDICNKAFYTQSQCSAHKRTHKEEKAHICELCGSAFFKRGDLTKHTRTVHLPSRLFACKFCRKKGTRMDNMRSHVRSHHKTMSRDQIINMIEVIE